MNAVATITPAPPRSVLVTMSSRYGMEPVAFESTLRKTVCKGDVSREEFAAFLLVAQEYGLNPLTKELYAFPAKGGGIQPIVSIDGWSRIINDHPAFDGMEFEDVLAGADVIAITCRMFRKDRSHAIEATEYMAECKRTTDVWRTWPRRMLRHKAMIQCARYAFGFSGIVDPDEYERQVEQVRQTTPAGLTARLQAGPASPEGFTASQVDEPAHDPETGEVAEFVDAPADDGLPIRDDAAEGFPGDAPADEPKPDLPPMKTGADLLAETETAKPSLAERVAEFKASCAAAGTVKLMDAWRKSSVLRSDLDASDPEEVAALTSWWNAAFDAAEAAEKGG
jgi:phage recombination protein Bet